jgi:hypothetical protein
MQLAALETHGVAQMERPLGLRMDLLCKQAKVQHKNRLTTK